MQATLDATALKPFTRALACLARYGDELIVCGLDDGIAVYTSNSSKTAYASAQFGVSFFSKYHLGRDRSNGKGKGRADEPEEEPETTKGQVTAKSLLSILRSRTADKTVERCEMSIVDGIPDEDDANEDHDSLESKLIIRLHCKHGVVKTHRLLLLAPTLLTPAQSESFTASNLTIGPRALKDIIEHFPAIRTTGKHDAELLWLFDDNQVQVKTLASGPEAKNQLSTELTISAGEFDVYDIFARPCGIAFALREFIATIAFAEALARPLELRFTDPAEPLHVFVDGAALDMRVTFVLATVNVPAQLLEQLGVEAQAPESNRRSGGRGQTSNASGGGGQTPMGSGGRGPTPMGSGGRGPTPMGSGGRGPTPNGSAGRGATPNGSVGRGATSHGSAMRRPILNGSSSGSGSGSDPAGASGSNKRLREAHRAPESVRKRPAKAAQETDEEGFAAFSGSLRMSMPPPSIPNPPSIMSSQSHVSNTPAGRARTPLFLLSQAEEAAIRSSGLGVLEMGEDELREMLEGEGEEVLPGQSQDEGMELELEMGGQEVGDESQVDIEFSQDSSVGSSESGAKRGFRPLFED